MVQLPTLHYTGISMPPERALSFMVTPLQPLARRVAALKTAPYLASQEAVLVVKGINRQRMDPPFSLSTRRRSRIPPILRQERAPLQQVLAQRREVHPEVMCCRLRTKAQALHLSVPALPSFRVWFLLSSVF